jgi:hypothetical protein
MSSIVGLFISPKHRMNLRGVGFLVHIITIELMYKILWSTSVSVNGSTCMGTQNLIKLQSTTTTCHATQINCPPRIVVVVYLKRSPISLVKM